MSSNELPDIYALVAKYQGVMRGYILSLTADPHVTNDVLQETNLVICKKGSDFEKGSNFVAWACRIAYFEVLRHRTNAKRDKLVFDDSVLETLSEDAEKESASYAARKRALKHCLTLLSEGNKQLVLQRYFEGLPLETIAAGKKSNPNAISQVLFRIRKQLLSCIERTQVNPEKI